jgi:hypothetical protein
LRYSLDCSIIGEYYNTTVMHDSCLGAFVSGTTLLVHMEGKMPNWGRWLLLSLEGKVFLLLMNGLIKLLFLASKSIESKEYERGNRDMRST